MSSLHVRLSPPPRRVPLSLVITNLFGGGAQIGWLVFGFGMMFFWGFVMHADYSFFTELGERAQTNGIVQSVERSAASENNQPIMAHHYEFSVAGRAFRGTSYSSDRHAGRGDTVTVEYLKANPLRSRIVGMRREMFGPGVAFITIFPLGGLLFIVLTLRLGARQNAILRNGMVGAAGKTQVSPLGPRLTRFARLLGATDQHLQRIQVRSAMQRKPAEGEIELYDPQLPGSTGRLSPAQIDENGDLRGSAGRGIRLLLVPILVLGLNSLPILTRLGVDWVGAVRSLFERLVS